MQSKPGRTPKSSKKTKEIKEEVLEESNLSFIEKFQNRIAVVKKDGSFQREDGSVGEKKNILEFTASTLENSFELENKKEVNVKKEKKNGKEKNNFNDGEIGCNNIKGGGPKRKVAFKPYTLDDYRTQKQQFQGLRKLGGLGPDLANEELKKKKKSFEKKIVYGNLVAQKNKEEISKIKKHKTPQKSLDKIVEVNSSSQEEQVLDTAIDEVIEKNGNNNSERKLRFV